MRSAVLNRSFEHPADGWYAIETPGEHPNAAAGIVQVIDPKAVDSIVNRFNAEADAYEERTGKDFPGMLIDHEHFKLDPDKETIAYGWLMRLENRGGVPYGQINWTGTGKPAVDGGDYRFFSTEYAPSDLVVLNAGKPRRVRPMRLSGLILTNDPNNKKGATPITNRVGIGPDGNAASPGPEYFPTLDLDAWFAAVASIQMSAEMHGKVALAWGDAWNLAKLQFPELYAAAFPTDATGDDDEASAAAAGVQLQAVANRIRRTFGVNFDQSWNFIRQQVPQVFNRMNPGRKLILNRQPARQNIARQASGVLRQMATARKASLGIPLETAWLMVSRQNRALVQMAEGEATLPQALAMQPELGIWFPEPA